MSNKQRITIKEIAEEAGVSKQTVSRVLNNRPDVSPETRKRIQAIIDRWGYQPSQLALNLSRGRTSTIGVISTGVQHYGPAQILTGIEEQAHHLGYSLSLSLLHNSHDAQIETTLRKMRAEHVAGIIWASISKMGDEQDQILEMLTGLELLAVATGQPYQGITTVHADGFTGAKLATQHLIEQGFNPIGIITGPKYQWSANQRLLGWKEALQLAKIPIDEDLIVEGDWTSSSGANSAKLLIEQRPEIEAIYVSNDHMALGVLSAAKAIGRQVPENLGVVGDDDIPEARYFTPPLSTVRQDLVEMGRMLVHELDCLIQARLDDEYCETQTVVIPPELIVRASSGVDRQSH
jgi:LacI family transcriptional regulator